MDAGMLSGGAAGVGGVAGAAGVGGASGNGGSAGGQPCASGTWDHDGDPATICQPWTPCDAGEFAASSGTATQDQQCEACPAGSFSEVANATQCIPWTVCEAGEREATAGSATTDRTCEAAEWLIQVGNGTTHGNAVATDAAGNGYLVGHTGVGLAGEALLGSTDGFLQKYDTSGNLLWTRHLGSSEPDKALGVSIDGAGNIWVVGDTDGALPGQSSAGRSDAFVQLYDAEGTLQWSRQWGTDITDTAVAVHTDAAGNGYVVGTVGDRPRAIFTWDGFIRKYDSAGQLQWERKMITVENDGATGVAADSAGNTWVAGLTAASLDGQPYLGGLEDAFLQKYDSAGDLLWTRQFGTDTSDRAYDVAINASGESWVVGTTDGNLDGQSTLGGKDAFLRLHDADGAPLWTRQLGNSGDDLATSVSIDGSGHAWIGGYVGDSRWIGGEPNAGQEDGFIQRYDPQGTLLWTRTLGTQFDDQVSDLALVDADVWFVGRAGGTLPESANSGGGFISRFVD